MQQGQISAVISRLSDISQNGTSALLDMVDEILLQVRQSEAAVLLVLDQMEELLGLSDAHACNRFLDLLRHALERGDGRLLVLATLRSEYLGEVQILPFLTTPTPLPYGEQTLDPVPLERLDIIIREPGRRWPQPVEFADRLVERIVRDTGARDALPLLAFTLHRLWCDTAARADGLFQNEEYERLGGLEGSVRTAADEALALPRRTPAEIEALREVFVPALVRVDAEGVRTRRRAFLADIAPATRALLKGFIDLGLLVTDRDPGGRETVEVAHEALLRTWPQLDRWLADDQDALRLLDGLDRAARDWENGKRAPDLLAHRGGRLTEVQALLGQDRFKQVIGEPERQYLDAAVQAEAERAAQVAEEQERRVRDAERITEEQRKVAQRTMFGAGIAVLLMLIAGYAALLASQQSKNARHQLAALYEEQGRQELLMGQHERALAYLNAAYSQGADSASLRYLIAQAARPLGVPRVSLKDENDPIREAAFSADNRLVITVGEKGAAKVWNARTGAVVLSVGGDASEPVSAASFSPDSTHILTISRSGKAVVRSIDNPANQGSIGNPDGGVRGARFSPRAPASVLTEGPGGRLEVWDGHSGKRTVSLQGPTADIETAAFSADGSTIAAAAAGTLWVWKSDSGDLIRSLDGPADPVKSIALSDDGSKMLTITNTLGAAQLWDVAKGEQMVRLGGVRGAVVVEGQINADGTQLLARTQSGGLLPWSAEHGGLTIKDSDGSWIRCAALSPDGKRIALGKESGWAGVVDAVTGERVASVMGHSLRVNSIAFSPDGKRILTASDDRTAEIWDVDRDALVATLAGHSDGLTSVAFSSDGQDALTIGRDASARLWEAPRDDLLNSQEASTKEIGVVTFSPDGKLLLSAGYEAIARVWDASSRRLVPVAEVKGLDPPIAAAAFSGDQGSVITGGFEGTVRISNARTGKEMANRSEHTGAIRSLGTGEARVISAGADWAVRTWDTTSPAPPAVFNIPGERREVVALSRDGRLVAAPDAREGVNIWSVADGKLVAFLGEDAERLRYASFGLNGSRVLLIRENDVVRHYKTAKIWDVASRSPLVSLQEGADLIEVASLSADGTLAVSGHGDGQLRVWDPESGRLLAALSKSGSPISAVAFSPGSERIVVGRRDGTVQIWDVNRDTRSPEQLSAFVKQRVAFQLRDGRLLPVGARALPR
jgi:WD40 repeat protein